jgi:uncharacterized membrane protein YfcA
LGERLFVLLIGNASPDGVTITQNAILIVLTAFVFAYMLAKAKLPSLRLKGLFISLSVGLSLGLVSSFLGIGGGPINVAAIAFLFSFPIKMAMRCSLMTILFSQAAKLTVVFLQDCLAGTLVYDLSLLPVMIIGGALGGYLGGVLNRKLTGKSSSWLFCAAQIAVVCICAANIVRALGRV